MIAVGVPSDAQLGRDRTFGQEPVVDTVPELNLPRFGREGSEGAEHGHAELGFLIGMSHRFAVRDVRLQWPQAWHAYPALS